MDSLPTTNATLGAPESLKNTTLETGASLAQRFPPINRICAHLHAFHAYASDPHSRAPVATHHYCAHLNDDVRQCILYDSSAPNARILGIEYMVKPHIYETLPAEERKLWHSHVFEVKSGMLVMPLPEGSLVPERAWEEAETKEMEEVVVLYGKVYHLWQVERGDKVPLGEPQLMTSYTGEGQMDWGRVEERDREMGVDSERKREIRRGIQEPQVHPDADAAWKKA